MPLRVHADAELVTVTYLRTVADVTTLIGGAAPRVGTEVPKTPTFPLLVVRRFGGLPRASGQLDAARLQLDAWAAPGAKAAARQVAATAQAAMLAMPTFRHAGAVVTGVEDELGLSWQPDETSGNARYVLGFAVFIHPA